MKRTPGFEVPNALEGFEMGESVRFIGGGPVMRTRLTDLRLTPTEMVQCYWASDNPSTIQSLEIPAGAPRPRGQWTRTRWTQKETAAECSL